jgi:hypothetical protein
VLRRRQRDRHVAAEVLVAEQHRLARDPQDRRRQRAHVDRRRVADLPRLDLEVPARLDPDEALDTIDPHRPGDRRLPGPSAFGPITRSISKRSGYTPFAA